MRDGQILALDEGEVFVFGSNATGAHGAGAALDAFERFGAIWGQGNGLQGHAYGIDTMSGEPEFRARTTEFLAFAAAHPVLRFLVTEVGCGIAGYRVDQVAPWFRDAPPNVVLPERFARALGADGGEVSTW